MSFTACSVALSQMRLVMSAPDRTKISVLAMNSSSSLQQPSNSRWALERV